VSIFEVERILRYEPPAALADAPGFVEGVVPYAGGVAAVVDMRKRLGLPVQAREDARVMLVRLGGRLVGLVVDLVREVLTVDTRTIAPPPEALPGLAREHLAGTIAHAGRMLLVLNPGRLFSSQERLALQEALP
jgi:purine-binding chemotaxis protein CheW